MANNRSTKPEAGNKYYITKGAGGYSTCIVGSPKDPISNVLANCVGFADGFWNEGEGLGKELVPLNCNAENFIERAIAYGLSVYQEPMVGGIMVWQKGPTLSGSDGAGHVAGVYAKPDANTIKTSESGYGGSAFWTATRTRGNGSWGAGSGYTYRGCIAPRGYNPTPTPPAPTPPTPGPSGAFNIGDKVVINGPLYQSSDANTATGSTGDRVTNITRKNPGSAHPYNTTGDLGWMDESSIRTYTEPTPPAPQPEPQPTGLQVGDKVEIIGKGNGASDGSANTAGGIGWTRYITKIYAGRAYPYQVGNQGKTDGANTTGFYQESALRKI